MALMTWKLSSTKAALLVIAYNCLLLPVASALLVFAWRVAIGTFYGYAKYEPVIPVGLLLLVAVGAEIILAAQRADEKNVRGLLIGMGISVLLSPVVLMFILLSLMLGNR